MSDPISLRNIPPESLLLAKAICSRTGLSLNAILRLALASGMLVEITKIAPDQAGTYGGLQPIELARALRGHLGSAIDLLMEQGQHPYSALLRQGNKREYTPEASHQEALIPLQVTSREGVIADGSMGDDLEALGIGKGLSETQE
jgi:hypothetical protein